jgi:hypothetical protein
MAMRQSARNSSVAVMMMIAALLGQALSPMAAFAAFQQGTPSTATFSTATIQPPTAVTAMPSGSKWSCSVTLTWSLPPTGMPTYWLVQRYDGGVASGSENVVLGLFTIYIDLGVPVKNTYTWQVRAVSGTWTSLAATATTENVSNSCK